MSKVQKMFCYASVVVEVIASHQFANKCMNFLTLQESLAYLSPTICVCMDVHYKEAHIWSVSPQGEWDGGCEELTASWCMKLSLWCLLSLTCWQNSDLCLVAWHHYHSSSKMDSLAWHWRYYWNPISDISQRKCALPRDVSMPALIYDCAIPPIAHKAQLHVECIIVKQEVTLALATWQCIIFSTLCPIPTERNVEFPALWSACGCNTLSSLISKTHIIKGQTLFILTPWMLKYKRILF